MPKGVYPRKKFRKKPGWPKGKKRKPHLVPMIVNVPNDLGAAANRTETIEGAVSKTRSQVLATNSKQVNFMIQGAEFLEAQATKLRAAAKALG